jgi:Beta-propeller repeat
MNSKRIVIAICAVLTVCIPVSAGPQRPRAVPVNIPLGFEENRGQAEAPVRYLAHAPGYTLQLSPTAARFNLRDGHAIAMRLAGANAQPVLTGGGKLPGKINYCVGAREQWKLAIPSFNSVRYSAVYPGIDLVFHGNQHQPEYDFVLAPKADLKRIELLFEGVDALTLDPDGSLELRIGKEVIKQKQPRAFIGTDGNRRELPARYVLTGANTVRFAVSPYDTNQPLVIDPVIAYSTYWGSSNQEIGNGIAAGTDGSAYIGGTTTGNISLGFLSKLDPSGTNVLYMNFFGDGSCNATVKGVAVDGAGNAYVTGLYGGKDQFGYCNNKYVLGAKVDGAGNMAYYRYYGGGDDYGNAIAVDRSGNAYLTGKTNGGFPVTNSSQGGFPGDAFILQLDPSGRILYATYLGGGLIDEGLAIATDSAGGVYVAGTTSSANFPVSDNAYQTRKPAASQTAFVSKVNVQANTLDYSTYLGGIIGDEATGIAVGNNGLIYVAGETESEDFPTTANAYDQVCGTDGHCNPAWSGGEIVYAEDAFVAVFNPSAYGTGSLIYSTYLGGTGHDYGQAIALDAAGHVFVTGSTASYDFPSAWPTQANYGGNTDAFVAELDPMQPGAASLLFSTFEGGNDYDEGLAIAVDSSRNIYLTGRTNSTAFPIVGAIQPTNSGGYDAFITKIATAAEFAPQSKRMQ